MKYLCFNGHDRKNNELFCNVCGSPFEIIVDEKYHDKILDNYPYIKKWINLGEVTTPVIGNGDLYFKLDYYSPTFSYKDRGSRTLISYLASRYDNHNLSINEDSSGNAGASIAAYGHVAGFNVNIFVPETANAMKLGQIKLYGANIIKVKGSRDEVQNVAMKYDGIYASHVLNPEFRDGIRTLAYEIFNQFEHMPDRVFIPVSAGTLLSGLFSGFKHLLDSGEINKIPEIIGVQPEIISPLCSQINGTLFDENNDKSSVADALVSKKPVLIKKMYDIIKNYGRCVTVSENEIITARGDLALSGILTEYSSATVYAAYKKLNKYGKNLLILTGNGLKTNY
ncbi:MULTISPECIES: pyridoxal-phosphate dependent enzyme [Acidiplasma]|jgi:threonine synthase|uniref:Threonine synthase n=1 Tax=Acidiplasma aeolicum TaxID=507754 RepID=A0A0Q0RZV1_9ARCH|nr:MULTISPECIES: pyridoxal-phosphate dependent enzyme [Acidiplasma]KQB36139.1 threonine synthase [Acidiplasma aeolicum]